MRGGGERWTQRWVNPELAMSVALSKAAFDSLVAVSRSAFGARTIFLNVSRAGVKLACTKKRLRTQGERVE